MPIETLIFDFDGTLADSFDVTLEVANGFAQEYSYRAVTREEAEWLRGRPYREVASYIGIAWHRIPRVAVRVRKEIASRIPKLPMFAGLPQVLLELRKQCNLGILTSNSEENVAAFLAAHDLDAFDFITTASNVWGKGRRLKALLRARGLNPASVAYVGDEVRDVEATQVAAVRMIAVSWGYTPRETLAAHRPAHLVDTPQELLELVSTESRHR